MEALEDKYSRIVDLLERRAPTPMSVTAIARELGIPRNSAAKYLDVLAARGDVSMDQFGQKKLYRPSPRIPLAELFERLSSAIVILNNDLQIRMVNSSFVSLLGILSGRNIVGTSLFDLNLPVFAEPVVRRNIERVQKSQTYLPEMQLIDELTDRIFLVEFVPVVMQIGSPGVMVGLRDITALRKAETALKYTEKKVATLFETVPSGIIMFSADGTILNANPASLEILGLKTFDDLSTASIFNVACVPERLEALIRGARADETELACDFDRMKREGVPSMKSGVVYFNVIFTPIRPENGGRPDEFAILFKDITRDRQQRKELTFRESRYHSFFENACNGVIIYEPIDGGDDYVIKDLNQAAEEQLGAPKAELVGQRVFERFPDLLDYGVPEAARRVLTTDAPVFLKPLQYRHGQGIWIWHYVFKLPSGELASFMIDVSGDLETRRGPPARGGDGTGATGCALPGADDAATD
jgi:PAS domain S-box-containing protein